MLKIGADFTTRTIRIIETEDRDLPEHEAINKANRWLFDCGERRGRWQILDTARQNYNTVDVLYRYHLSGDVSDEDN